MTESRITSAEREVSIPAAQVFKLIADPARHPQFDGNDNLSRADQGQRIDRVGQRFTMELTNGQSRDNEVVEFEEGRRIAWKPAPVGEEPRGHVWRWELEPVNDLTTLVRHTYDWSELTDETRFERARANTEEALSRSVTKLAELAETLDAGIEVTD
ncbi:SRPBCC family protein [Yaniella flava]|uniref:SRPBCC family protein n=1 Tax=Yaniella flava TaxID=287930 RepID=A0ABN2U0F1_9MICC|nr:SRPBCC family protein [Micrococcaceae bacterium]